MLAQAKKDVDNTSSVLLLLGKNKKQMAYDVICGDVIIRCGNAKEAALVAKELNAGKASPQTMPWRLHEFTEFVNRIQWQQRRLLNILLHSVTPVPVRELCLKLHLSGNQALAGVLSGITKVAQTLDIDPGRIYKQDTTYSKGRPERKYRVVYAFRQAAKENSWPSQEDLEIPAEDD
jgi:hypothetical protein